MRKNFFHLAFNCSIAILLLITNSLVAQWPTSPDSALYVGHGSDAQVVSDGLGGVFVVTGNSSINCYRINHLGEIEWGPVQLEGEYNDQYDQSVALSSDGSLIVSYVDILFIGGPDWGDANIRVQKISSEGLKLWGDDVVVTPDDATGPYDQFPNAMLSYVIADDAGGAYVAWDDYRNDDDAVGYGELYMQHIGSTGLVTWDSLGTLMVEEVRGFILFKTSYHLPVILYYYQTETGSHFNISQMDETGNELSIEQDPEVLSGGSYYSLGLDDNLYFSRDEKAFKYSLEYIPLFPEEGLVFSDSTYRIRDILPDGFGGLIINYRKDEESDRNFSQWIENDGSLRFGIGGVHSLTAGGQRETCTLVDPESFIVTYQDWDDHKAQRVDINGNLLWPMNTLIHTYNHYTDLFPSAISDHEGGIIYVFDYNYNTYATQVGPDGSIGSITGLDETKYRIEIPSHLKILSQYPNPFNPMTTIEFEVGQNDLVYIEVFDLTGKQILSKKQPGYSGKNLASIDFSQIMMASGLYLVTLWQESIPQTKQLIKVMYLK